MLDLLSEDYPDYMSYNLIYYASQMFLCESNIRHKSYSELRKLFDNAAAIHEDKENVINQIKKLSLDIIGRDIFKREIRIVDGHDSSSYFGIMPVRVIDYADTNDLDSVAEMNSIEALSSVRENEFTAKIGENDTPVELIIDFYRRFIYRVEYMLRIGNEKGYDLISVMGP